MSDDPLAIRSFASKQFSRECVACVVVRSETGAEYTESRGVARRWRRLGTAILHRVFA